MRKGRETVTQRERERETEEEMDTEKGRIFKGKHPYERRREKKREHKACL